MKESVGILFPHQLFSQHQLLQECSKVYLVEEHLFFKKFNFHKMKIAFHRASMKAYFDRLKNTNLDVEYIESKDERSDIRELLKSLAEHNHDQIQIIHPADNWLERRIKNATVKHNIKVKEYESPLFLNSRSDLEEFFKPDKKSFFQTSFYKQQRKKRGILINQNDEPEGGKWSFDDENRKKFPKKSSPPPVQYPPKTKYWEEAITYVKAEFSDNIGEFQGSPMYPICTEQAEAWLEQFFEHRFNQFGDYEDAIVKDELILHHSILTPMLNVGLLQPGFVIQKTLDYAQNNNTPINSTEGFVRQIIGWREFIHGMYEVRGSHARTANFWGFKRKIPKSFYDGTTGIIPVDQTIKKVLETGYCHHIERLMILGNFMLLCEFDPDEVYRWFMELFIDAYDWVMVPNVYGMSQFADGGDFATKPYISGSNYVMKMSDYSKGEWQKYWDGLFWNFLDRQREFFLGNPRLSMLVRNFDKMSKEKQSEHLNNAAEFLRQLNSDSD